MSARTSADTYGVLDEVQALCERHPGLPAPYISIWSHANYADVTWYLQLAGNIDQAKVAAEIISAIGGTWDKHATDYAELLRFTRAIGRLRLDVSVAREEVCERVVVGVEQVTIPARPPADALPERVEEREVVEWRCGSVLAAATHEAVAS